MTAQHEYQLERYRAGVYKPCPSCSKRKFKQYVDDNGQPIARHVGKCERLDKCGYHYTPRQYFADNPTAGSKVEDWKASELWRTRHEPPAPKPIDYLPKSVLEASQALYERNNLARYLAALFGWPKALELAEMYRLGTSKRFKGFGGFAVVFWQIDSAGNVRQAKAMGYNPETGRRIKEPYNEVAFMGKQIAGQDANLAQCLFGAHLLAEQPTTPVCIVESEKTALICAASVPNAVWLATGGKNGARWTEPDVIAELEGRTVTLYPDLGAFDDWSEKAKILGTVCEYTVSDLLERKAGEEHRAEGYDIADLLTAPQQAPEQPEQILGLPPGFAMYGDVIEVDGIPAQWLNPTEMDAAIERARGYVVPVTA